MHWKYALKLPVYDGLFNSVLTIILESNLKRLLAKTVNDFLSSTYRYLPAREGLTNFFELPVMWYNRECYSKRDKVLWHEKWNYEIDNPGVNQKVPQSSLTYIFEHF